MKVQFFSSKTSKDWSQQDEDNCIPIKCLLIGDISVGKTSIINRAVGNVFDFSMQSTIGIDFHVMRVKVTDPMTKEVTCYKFQVWDCAGQLRFRSIVRSYYRHSNVILTVFDVCNRDTYDSILGWKNSMNEELAGLSGYKMYLLGNKTDLKGERTVPASDAEELSRAIGADGFFEVSARTASGIAECFNTIALDVHGACLSGEMMPRGLNALKKKDDLNVVVVDDGVSLKSGCGAGTCVLQ